MPSKLKNALKITAALGIGTLGAIPIQRAIQSAAVHDGSRLPHMSTAETKAIIKRMKDKFKLNVGYTHDPYFSGDNAMYISPDLWGRISKMQNFITASDLHPAAKKALINRIQSFGGKAGKHGIIITGRYTKKPEIIAHELGHAVAKYKGTALERLSSQPWVKNYRMYYHTIPAYAAGIAAGRAFGPVGGALIGGLTGLATDTPTLYNEYTANRYAKQLMNPDVSTALNLKALSTYLAGAGVGSALTGAVSGFLRR